VIVTARPRSKPLSSAHTAHRKNATIDHLLARQAPAGMTFGDLASLRRPAA
jgi:hypothetical protein